MRQIGYAMNGDDAFFGGSATPPPNPAVTHTREYADFSTGDRPPAQSTANPLLPVILIVVGVLVAVAAFVGYRVMMTGTQIELPDELMGLERLDDGDETVGLLKSNFDNYDLTDGVLDDDAEIQVGVYTSGQRTILVVAAEDGTDDAAEVTRFYDGMLAGIRSELPAITLQEEDAGPKGGTMKCFDAQSGMQVGGCVWVAPETFGLVIAPDDGDIAQTARDVRSAIES